MRRYCCVLFKESVEEGHIFRAKGYDETEWFLKEWFHIYYCPFCGTKVKGKGWGKYDIQVKTKNKKRKT